MLADPRVDVVYLATPIALHAPQGAAVLDAGKHLWCEKPLTTGIAPTLDLVERSRDRGRTLAEAFMYLFHPQFAALREVVHGGRLGRILSLTCRFGIPPLDRPGFRGDPALGGGAFLDVGCYPISALPALFPATQPAVVSAEIVTPPDSRVDVEGRAVVRYANGPSAVLEWRTHAAYRNEIDVWGSAGCVSLRRFFSKSASEVPELRFLDASGAERSEAGTPGNHFARMLAAFRDLLDDEGAAETERLRILERARLADAIVVHSLRG
jgi:predicted dehydrogenase